MLTRTAIPCALCPSSWQAPATLSHAWGRLAETTAFDKGLAASGCCHIARQHSKDVHPQIQAFIVGKHWYKGWHQTAFGWIGP